MNQSPQRSLRSRDDTALRVASWTLLIVLISTVSWVIFKSMQLRPGGDDYCWAVGAAYGPLDGPHFWWETFSGYVIHNVSLTYTVGMPLLHLPLSMVSALPFMIAALVVAGTAVAVALPSSRQPKSKRWSLGLVIPGLMVGWWTYWWLPMALQQDGINRWLAVSMVHNQNINGGYVIETCGAVLLFYLAWRLSSRRSSSWVTMYAVAGAWAAFSGPSIAVATVLTLVAAGLWWLGFSSSRNKTMILGIAVAMISTVTFSLIAHFSPGTQARASRMGTTFDLSLTKIGEWIHHVFPEAVLGWLNTYLTPGSLVVFGLAAAIGFLLSRRYSLSLTPELGKILAALAAFGLMLSVSSSVTNFFIYSAPYHIVPSRICAVIFLWFAGLLCGKMLAAQTWTLVSPFMLLAAFAVAGVAVGSCLNMTISIASRATAWSEGPAPEAGIVTDYLEWTNSRTCWQDLVQTRLDLPRRNQPDPPYEFNLEERAPALT